MGVVILIIIVIVICYKRGNKVINSESNKNSYDVQNAQSKYLFQSTNAPKSIQMPERTEKEPPFLSAYANIVPNNYEAYFKDGELFNVNPRNNSISLDEDRGIAYDARYIISDGIKYDLDNPNSVAKIKIPNFEAAEGMPYITRDLSNILRMRAGREQRPWIAVPLAYKAVNLMLTNKSVAWRRDDYLRISKNLWAIGEFAYGDALSKEIDSIFPYLFPSEIAHKNSCSFFDEQLDFLKSYNGDLLEIRHEQSVCGECAKYQGRVYSVSGKSKYYPKLPQFILQNKGLHCNNTVYARIGDDKNLELSVNKYNNNGEVYVVDVNAFKYSKRPFVDDRSEFAKENYRKKMEKLNEQEAYIRENGEEYMNRDLWTGLFYKRLEYQKIVDIMGDNAPKSYSAYRRMKKNNTKNYQKIADIATQNGVVLLND